MLFPAGNLQFAKNSDRSLSHAAPPLLSSGTILFTGQTHQLRAFKRRISKMNFTGSSAVIDQSRVKQTDCSDRQEKQRTLKEPKHPRTLRRGTNAVFKLPFYSSYMVGNIRLRLIDLID
jgi:hypothetical protein